jgi:hypothetical protein
MPRKRKPKPSARDWRVQTLTPDRDGIAALADLRRLATAVQAGGTSVAKTIEHWELSDIADHVERIFREISLISTQEQDAAMDRVNAATTEEERDAAWDAWSEAFDSSTAMTKRQGGVA